MQVRPERARGIFLHEKTQCSFQMITYGADILVPIEDVPLSVHVMASAQCRALLSRPPRQIDLHCAQLAPWSPSQLINMSLTPALQIGDVLELFAVLPNCHEIGTLDVDAGTNCR